MIDTAWDRLKAAMAHCDKCGKLVSENPWSVCPHCGYDIWDDFEADDPEDEEAPK